MIGRLSFSENWGNLLASLFYVHSIVYDAHPVIYPSAWTLEIEVQFYLVAPFFAMAIYRLKAGARLVLVGLLMLLFSSMHHLLPGLPQTILYQGHFFLAGFVLSEAYVTWESFFKERRYAYDVWAIAATALAFVIVPIHSKTIPGQLGILCGLSMIFLCGFKGRILSAFLRLPVICVVGGMCYSIYLLHGRIITAAYAYLMKNLQLTGQYLADSTILNLTLIPVIICTSAVFFVLIERPCMNPKWPQLLWKLLMSKVGRRSSAASE